MKRDTRGQDCEGKASTNALKRVKEARNLLTMAKLFDLAHAWIMHQRQADTKGRKESEQA